LLFLLLYEDRRGDPGGFLLFAVNELKILVANLILIVNKLKWIVFGEQFPLRSGFRAKK
jgi:hypothetical protein